MVQKCGAKEKILTKNCKITLKNTKGNRSSKLDQKIELKNLNYNLKDFIKPPSRPIMPSDLPPHLLDVEFFLELLN